MLTGHLDTKQRVLILEYPKRAHLPKRVVPVMSTDHAVTVWTVQARKYIFEQLRGFVLQRSKAVVLMTGARHARAQNAVDKLLFMLMGGYESTLPALCAKVVADSDLIEELAPGPFSRFRHHYQEVIMPIVEWCGNYLKDSAPVPTHS
ncbi:MAG TPA: hypothetical protein VNQ80_15305 [Parapedobacter sp.]|uniref:hypothetical protein n=1 Tax=Parapedobacter sp. TaxID=1958893 RepID=UPI002C4AEB73|nr:hypothetical protein [Parapedobacter sp.]HWK58709.1 hypothetical protein [Parapedobacter sp.]